jgi:glycosyltransferase involved in cell wall biosynthesis
VVRRLRREGTAVEVIHAHIHRMAWPAVIVGALLRRPVVVTENSSEWARRTMTSGALRRAKISFRRADLVCPVNRLLQRAIESYGIHAEFRIVPNTVDTDVFHPPDTKRLSAPPARLVNVAFHVEVKALDVLLRAFAIVVEHRAQLELTMIGEGPLTPDLAELAGDLGVAEQVHFIGNRQPAAIAEVLRASDVFVLSSLSENMPLSVIEAMCCGLPVAATNVGGVPEAVGEFGVLAPPSDPKALATAIDSVLAEYDRFDRAEIARRSASRFSFEAIGRTWSEIYAAL